jgi:hypothetical protein
MKKLILLAVTTTSLFASSSFAELAVGGYFGLNQAQPTATDTGSYSGKQGSEAGALLLLPFFPTLSFRFGLAQKIRKTHQEGDAGGGGGNPILLYTMNVSETLTDFALGVQWDLPVTDLYVMGGAKVSSSQSITCDMSTPNVVFTNCDKSKTDYPIFVGVGYNLVNFAIIHIAVEGEYERGSSAGLLGSKNNELTGRLMLKVGL